MLLYAIILIIMVMTIINHPKQSKESFAAVNDEALYSLSSMYDSGNLKVSNALVTKDLTVDGNAGIMGNISANGSLITAGDIHTRGQLISDSTDFVLSKKPNSRGNCGNCRAMVHDNGNVLTVNYGNDFKGGAQVDGNLNVTGQLNVAGQLKGNIPVDGIAWTTMKGRAVVSPQTSWMQCPVGQVMCGIGFEHNNNAAWWQESVKMRCCTVGKA
jgi:cytoskeletal protein CcmA (bactofilin family)